MYPSRHAVFISNYRSTNQVRFHPFPKLLVVGLFASSQDEPNQTTNYNLKPSEQRVDMSGNNPSSPILSLTEARNESGKKSKSICMHSSSNNLFYLSWTDYRWPSQSIEFEALFWPPLDILYTWRNIYLVSFQRDESSRYRIRWICFCVHRYSETETETSVHLLFLYTLRISTIWIGFNTIQHQRESQISLNCA